MIGIWKTMYAFWSAIAAAIIAQLSKPFFAYLKTHTWDWSLVTASGGFPSSHSALVSALSLSVGIHERFRSSIFAVTLALAVIVIYDAANVRYYSGEHIKVTQQLIKDLREKYPDSLTDPVYETKLKTILGHKRIEVAGGILLGLMIALFFEKVL